MIRFLVILLAVDIALISSCPRVERPNVIPKREYSFIWGSHVRLRIGPGSTEMVKSAPKLNYFDEVQVRGQQEVDGQHWVLAANAEGQEGWVSGEYVRSTAREVADKDIYVYLRQLKRQAAFSELPEPVRRKLLRSVNREQADPTAVSIEYYFPSNTCVIFLRGETPPEPGKRETAGQRREFISKLLYQPKETEFQSFNLLPALLQSADKYGQTASKTPLQYGAIETRRLDNDLLFAIDVVINEPQHELTRKIFFTQRNQDLVKAGEIVIHDAAAAQETVLNCTVAYRQWDSAKTRRIWANYIEHNRKNKADLYYRVSYLLDGAKLEKEYVKYLD